MLKAIKEFFFGAPKQEIPVVEFKPEVKVEQPVVEVAPAPAPVAVKEAPAPKKPRQRKKKPATKA